MNVNDTIFCPVRGLEKNIISESNPIKDGYIYFATDTGRIYLDRGTKRYSMGGSGAGGAGAAVYYIKTPASLTPNDDDKTKFTVFKSTLENQGDRPIFGDILLNITDGSFFRVLDEAEDHFVCERLAISGNGSGPGGVVGTTLEFVSVPPATVIDGQSLELKVIARSLLNDQDKPRDPELTVSWSLIDKLTGESYQSGSFPAAHGVETTFNLGAYLRPSTTTTCSMYARGLNSGKSDTFEFEVTSSQMELTHVSTFSNISAFDMGSVNFTFNTVGKLEKIATLVYDKGRETEYSTEVKIGPNTSTCDFSIPEDKTIHGYHTVAVDLYQDLGNGRKGAKVEPGLTFEIAVIDPASDMPIIWLDNYKNEYLEYDDIQIPFLVYDPKSTSVDVLFLNSGIQIGSRTITEFDEFEVFEITDATMEYRNSYSIQCGTGDYTQSRTIEFSVVPDNVRKMVLAKPNYLTFEFDAKGRSNSDPASIRNTWTYTPKEGRPTDMTGKTATFTNFNWRNNGWIMEDRKSVLRISNGAQVAFDLGDMRFAGDTNTTQSHTFEFQFKMRNIQNYSNLVKNITRYKNDNAYFTAFEAQTEFDNYDAYLRNVLGPAADNLEFSHVYKKLNLNNIVGNYASPAGNSAIGLCLGPQDAFFSNGTDTVSVNYVEEELINLSIVYEHALDSSSDSLIYIYINGVITGIIESGVTEPFNIGKDKLVFNANVCDIDLYSIRIYKTALNVADIVHNYAVDYKNATIYDQNQIAKNNDIIGEYQIDYKNMLYYNAEHPDDPLMPYIIFDTSGTTDDNLLPHKKNTTVSADVTFVNTVLDAAYRKGELQSQAISDKLASTQSTAAVKQAAVKNFYKHHCPSWVGFGVDMEVQGTSSEFYPRRNFKIKTKVEQSDGEKRAQIFLNKGPFEEEYNSYRNMIDNGETVELGKEPSRQDFWYMDNYTNGTERWTMKVDYMESSGSYNAGLAGLIRNAYSKHPLQDYISNNVIDPYKKNDDGQYVDNNGNVLVEEDFNKRVNALMSGVTKTLRWEDFRTSLLGFPVMAFHKRSEDDSDIIFIGYYRMLLDKGSDHVMGFDMDDSVTHNILNNKSVNDLAECWEFATNARTFCSYKDHWNRVELSFKGPKSKGDSIFISLTDNKIGGPVVLEHFEPRYVKNDDYLKNDEPGFYNFGNLTQDQVTKMCQKLKIDTIDITDPEAKYKAQDAAVDMMKNWEAACKWVYSTNIDNVLSQGSYTKRDDIGAVLYTPGQFFKRDDTDASGFSVADGAYEAGTVYFKPVTKTNDDGESYTDYEYAYAVGTQDKVYTTNTYYVEVNGVYSLSSAPFDGTIDYYTFTSMPEEEIAKIADRLVEPATEYNANTEYYIYNPDAEITGGITDAVIYRGKIDEETYNAGQYYVGVTKTYVGKQYKYDTKEYRTAKFINELKYHFDIEYLATYFVTTEVFELYDSRGKNCMMASWGPLDYKKDENGEYIEVDGEKVPGDYIWYPIFYDMDTQLGINNTGIPSFEFNVDATDNGNFSTSDSVLWNNFYRFFKNSAILSKYKHMKGVTEGVEWTKLKTPPLKDIKYLEGWYTFNPDYTKMIACKGDRPLIATNLDAYWKYITITNAKGQSTGITGYYDRDTGKCLVDTNGTYFYALQGDRSQSRRQFLTSRMEYVDSWLNQGNYQRGGSNCIRGRVSANNRDETSDVWLNGTDGYWVDGIRNGTKKYPFDAEHWVNLTPVRSSYVTLSDDSTAYPSQKYDGVSPVRFNINSIENGVLNSPNYPEQLLYIYGMNQMADVGAMHNLYWREFVIDGEATKLTKLNLGYDGLVSYTDDDGVLHENVRWYNQRLNQPSIPAAKVKGSKGMPLLKEVNLSNITIQAGSGSPSLDLTSCEKLENFRATGSTLASVKFAEGVSLNTLYVPSSLTALELDHANLLTDLIIDYESPTVKVDGSLEAKRGLYIEGLFDADCALTKLNLKGGALGYHSYTVLKQFYDMLKAKKSKGSITVTEVEWSPFTRVYEGELYDDSATYMIDNGHYGLVPYTEVDRDKFYLNVLSGNVYRQTRDIYIAVETDEEYSAADKYFTKVGENYVPYVYTDESAFASAIASGLYRGDAQVFALNDSTVGMLIDFIDKADYTSASAAAVPELSGIIYINNTEAYDEGLTIKDKLQVAYPNMTFFFANEITKAYSARFILIDKETGAEGYVVNANGSTAPSVQKISKQRYDQNNTLWFTNPYTEYIVDRDHWDFSGWSTEKTADGLISHFNNSADDQANAWRAIKDEIFDPDVYDYTFYAILDIHFYDITFKDIDNPDYSYTIKVQYDLPLHANVPNPVSIAATDLYARNGFRGWAIDDTKAGVYEIGEEVEVTDVTKYKAIQPYTFWAIYQKESVFDTVVDNKYFDFIPMSYNDEYDTSYNKTGYRISINDAYRQKGHFNGKVTLPSVAPDGSPIVAIAPGGFAAESGLTHVFFDNKHTNELRKIDENAFQECADLKYLDFTNLPSLRVIGARAFASTTKFSTFTMYDPLVEIGIRAFNLSGDVGISADLVLNPMLQNVGTRAFANGFNITALYIGTKAHPSELVQSEIHWDRFDKVITQNPGYNPKSAWIYFPKAKSGIWNDWFNNTDDRAKFCNLDEIDGTLEFEGV